MFGTSMLSKVFWFLFIAVMAIILQQLLATREYKNEKPKQEMLSNQEMSSRYEVLTKHKMLSKQEIDDLIASAEGGASKAQKELGNVYYYGKGTITDIKKALYWWEKAANQGHVSAQFNLGVFYLKKGPSQDISQAIFWLDRAAKNGDEEAVEQLQLAIKMKEVEFNSKIAEQRQGVESQLKAKKEKQKLTCKRCAVGRTKITVICDGPVKDAKLRLNCIRSGTFSRLCYDWRGDLKEGENSIPLNRFTLEDGKKFNPDEHEVRTLLVTRINDVDERSYFDFTKQDQ